MTVQDTFARPRAASPSTIGATLIVLALACGGFGIGVGEFAVMGLLPQVAAGFNASVPDAGYVITAYAVGVVVGAPLIAIAAARISRRSLLLMLMSLFMLGNLASASAPNLASLIALRFLTGLPHGAYFGVAAALARLPRKNTLMRMSSRLRRETRAAAMAMSGAPTTTPAA